MPYHISSPQNSSSLDLKSSSPHTPASTVSICSLIVFHLTTRSATSSYCLALTWPRFCFLGLSLTQTWTTANSLETKLELEDNLTKGLKAEILSNYLPAKSTYGGKLNLHYKQPNVHVRSFIDLFKGPVATVDLTLGHEGFLVGAEGGYDVQKAAITKYSLAAGYSQGSYAAAITATNNLSIFSASYYHKVNAQVDAGAKATWDSTAGSNVGLEVASKYALDPSSFAKVRHYN
jgi:voltage-dependent anion channel protein 2